MKRLIAFVAPAVASAALLVNAGTPASAAPVQPFDISGAYAVDWTTCFGGAAPDLGSLTCGAGSSDSAAPANTALDAYQIVRVPQGSRLVESLLVYAPQGSGAWETTAIACGPTDANNDCTAGAVTGSYSAQLDFGCTNGPHDIIATPASTPGVWPGAGWDGYDLIRTAASVAEGGAGEPLSASPNGYVPLVRPQPPSSSFASLESTTLTHVWVGGITLMPLPVPRPLQVATYLWDQPQFPRPYAVTAMPAGAAESDPRLPPIDDYTCFDSPQDSVLHLNNVRTPSVPRLMPRWAVMQSAPDIVDGQVGRILDYQCVNVGGFAGADADADCLPAGSDSNDLNPDIDGDLLPDGLEDFAFSSSSASDSDGDGAQDYAEMFQLTNAWVTDSDGDGSMDKFDDGSDEGAGSDVLADDTTADDNCPTDANPSQVNTDSDPLRIFVPNANILSSSAGNPAMITTTAPHSLTNGAVARIRGHQGSTPSINNSDFEVSSVTATTFTIPIEVTVGGAGGSLTQVPTAVAIVSSSVGSPSVITTAVPHFLANGMTVDFSGHTGSTPNLNTGTYTVANVTATTFTIGTNVTVGGTGGYVRRSSGVIDIVSSGVGNPTVITTNGPHALATGMTAIITGHAGSTPALNGEFVVTVTGPSTFTVPVDVTSAGAGGSFITQPGLPVVDETTPAQDPFGDACDFDDDNDALHDLAEPAVTIVPWSGNTDPGGAGDLADTTVCVGAGIGAAPVVVINTLDPDSDEDGYLDGRECQMSARPALADGDISDPSVNGDGLGSCKTAPVDTDGCARIERSGVTDPDADKLYQPTSAAGHLAVETFFRTRGINTGVGTQSNDGPDPDLLAGDSDADSDNDALIDGIEVWSYGTDPMNPDTDGDGCADGKEAADINGNRVVNAQDLALLLGAIYPLGYGPGSTYRSGNGTITAQHYKKYGDFNRNFTLAGGQDNGQIAVQQGIGGGLCNSPLLAPPAGTFQHGRVITNQTKPLP